MNCYSHNVKEVDYKLGFPKQQGWFKFLQIFGKKYIKWQIESSSFF